MQELVGMNNYPYFSTAIAQLIGVRYFHIYFACSIVAWLHLLAEWLYSGKYPQKPWLGLLLGLFLAGLVNGFGLQPRLKALHKFQYTHPQQREEASRSFQYWQGISRGINLLMLAGVGLYLWRVGNPPDPTRFVSAGKFRG